MKKTLGVLVIVIVLAVVGWAAYGMGKSKNNSNNNSVSQTTNNANSSTNSNSNESSNGSINIKNMMFTPSQITVAKGGSVTWTNNDSVAHTVVDDLGNVGGPNSGEIAPGATYSFTFAKTGSFQYHCSIHPSMRGTIVVK